MQYNLGEADDWLFIGVNFKFYLMAKSSQKYVNDMYDYNI